MQPKAAVVRRELFQLVALAAAAVAAFFLTRGVAARDREMTFRDAESWYRAGEAQLAAGHVDAALDSLRRAAVRNRYDRRYALALARALARKGDTESARAALLTLRDASPEDPEVSLQLARVDAQRGDITEAVRFYHNALYAPWPAESADARREVRFELVDLELRNGETARALSELLAVTSDLPDDAAAHTRVAQLFARAGDPRRALAQYERALRLSPGEPSALAGAGEAAFAIGDFERARTYLRDAPVTDDRVARTRGVVDAVLSDDPLARGIRMAERKRRLTDDLDYLGGRLQTCGPSGGAPPAGGGESLRQETATMRGELDRPGAFDQDFVDNALDLFGRVVGHLARACGPLAARDEALALIARRNAADRS